jgi:dihydrodipicolinate synthase/N-acetylneuraminate lyase
VRKDPNQDAYLEGLLKRVDRTRVISGMGERPAIAHMRDWKLPGFTTGSGCVAPRLSRLIHEHCVAQEYQAAEELRARFMPLEDLRDAWGPARVLHAAAELAAIASAGPIAPYISAISTQQSAELAPVARALLSHDAAAPASAQLARV